MKGVFVSVGPRLFSAPHIWRSVGGCKGTAASPPSISRLYAGIHMLGCADVIFAGGGGYVWVGSPSLFAWMHHSIKLVGAPWCAPFLVSVRAYFPPQRNIWKLDIEAF